MRVWLEKVQRCPAFGRRLTSYSDSQLNSRSYLPRIYLKNNKKRVLYVFIPWLWFSASGEHGKRELELTITHTFSSLLPIYFVSADGHSCAKGLIRRWLAERKKSPAKSNQKSPCPVSVSNKTECGHKCLPPRKTLERTFWVIYPELQHPLRYFFLRIKSESRFRSNGLKNSLRITVVLVIAVSLILLR